MNLQRHKLELQEYGYTRFPELINLDLVSEAHSQISNLAKEHGLLAEGLWMQSEQRFSEVKPFRTALKSLTNSSSFPNLLDDKILHLTESLIGNTASVLPPGQQVLFTLPGAEAWCVPADAWHVDSPRLGDSNSSGLQAFTFLQSVEAKGGGTLIVAGSHRLMNTSSIVRSKEFKAYLKEKSYFRTLMNKQRDPITDLNETKGTVDGINLEVVELIGRPGDVYFMDLRVLHTPAPNSSNDARIMLTCRHPTAAAVFA